jgi:hypothetical protein
MLAALSRVALDLEQQALRLTKAGRFLQRLQNVPFGFGLGVAARVQQTSQLIMHFRRIGRVKQK